MGNGRKTHEDCTYTQVPVDTEGNIHIGTAVGRSVQTSHNQAEVSQGEPTCVIHARYMEGQKTNGTVPEEWENQITKCRSIVGMGLPKACSVEAGWCSD